MALPGLSDVSSLCFYLFFFELSFLGIYLLGQLLSLLVPRSHIIVLSLLAGNALGLARKSNRRYKVPSVLTNQERCLREFRKPFGAFPPVLLKNILNGNVLDNDINCVTRSTFRRFQNVLTVFF